ncbi:hypothetical protein NDU88_003364 [Pleurodeles waltl]|uniref:Uncharacterized protein n=1 Tax=Pleurodeles waltl TaxID=8319 RepID=A0AAV7V0D1_PLEWA|nr:hypothetical protein NDU88_003364 [Pleurodeles waltl]
MALTHLPLSDFPESHTKQARCHCASRISCPAVINAAQCVRVRISCRVSARVESRAGIARAAPNSLKDAKAGAGSRAKNVARDEAHPIVDSTGTYQEPAYPIVDSTGTDQEPASEAVFKQRLIPVS